MRNNLYLGQSGGLGVWLVSGFIAIAAAVWTFWVVVFGLLVVALLALIGGTYGYLSYRWRRDAPARRRRRDRRARLRQKPYRIYR